ncbi:hypothetical protein VP01_1620g1 [Puccinia sorghi]|uniref:Reverse transcriptase Ty1/copia-type domain-containing protein n=1 Tax=Puccinia sorghi TaxID=27349 RepID=A0A0L6VGZ0_9BASI|nr:hypothetical protein VP01_1620g1 [Puccinia sorghi]
MEKDPTSFNKAVDGEKSKGLRDSIECELPEKLLNLTWVLCIKGSQQKFGKDYFDTFSPTGKFLSLLTLLVLAIDLQISIKQFYVKSVFLFAPLQE